MLVLAKKFNDTFETNPEWNTSDWQGIIGNSVFTLGSTIIQGFTLSETAKLTFSKFVPLS
jgi:hypothetical protein